MLKLRPTLHLALVWLAVYRTKAGCAMDADMALYQSKLAGRNLYNVAQAPGELT